MGCVWPNTDPCMRSTSPPSPPNSAPGSPADARVGLVPFSLAEDGHHQDGLQVVGEMNENCVGQHSFIHSTTLTIILHVRHGVRCWGQSEQHRITPALTELSV